METTSKPSSEAEKPRNEAEDTRSEDGSEAADPNIQQRWFFSNWWTIAWLATVSLLGALMVLVTMTIPVVESDAISASWYRSLWWTFSGAIAFVSGLFVSVVLTLLVTIIGAVDVLRPE